MEMSYVADAKRYDGAQFRRCGQSGLKFAPDITGAMAELWRRRRIRDGQSDDPARI